MTPSLHPLRGACQNECRYRSSPGPYRPSRPLRQRPPGTRLPICCGFSKRRRAKRADSIVCPRWPGSFPPSGACRYRSASCSNRCCATAMAARSLPSMCGNWPVGRPGPSARMKLRSSLRAWYCKTSPACRCWPTWPRCAARPCGWGKTRRKSSRWCRWVWLGGKALGLGKNPQKREPLVPVDLVVDHSIMVDHYGRKDALDLNMKLEFQRNRERYEFMKWGMQAFDRLGVVPPGFGIVHQVNLEYLARGVHQTGDGIHYPDTLVGTDSHTTMINGIGVVGWGVGGIEAEAAMLGQPVYFITPDVVGVELAGQLREGVTATDLVLTVTELLRQHKVVGKFVEFFGAGTRTLALPDRATIANMAPEYGATMGFFPVDEKTIAYFQGTGRSQDEIAVFEAHL